MKVKSLCPLCKRLVDSSEAYKEYRKSKEYKKGIYPKWSYTDNLPDHLVNFHRLPKDIGLWFVAGVTLGELMTEQKKVRE